MKRILTVLATGFFLAAAAHAQAPDAPLPNAPVATAVYSTPSPTDSTSRMAAWNTSGSAAQKAAATPTPTPGEVSLYTVVDLALRNSKTVRMAEAEQQRTRGFLNETRDAYIPNLSVGSGLGYSYGFPLGTPTLYNVTSNSLLFSFSQHDYIRSARSAWKAATLSLKNTRQQVILDASLNYIELNKTLEQTAALNQALADSDKLVAVVQDRLNAGLESKVNLTRAQLTRAQIHLQKICLEDHADELREHLSGLTGLDTNAITPATASVPPLPDLDFQGLMSKGNNAPAVQAAAALADAKLFSAWGDEKQNYRPTIQFAFQYARFATFNNYSQYYQHFNQYNNIGVGIQAVWPLFDPVRRAKAMEAKAQAAHDREQAEISKIQNDEQNFTLWHNLRELEAEEQVADLQQQLAQDTLASIVTQMNQGAANGQPVPPQQADQYRVEERTRFVGLEDAQFDVTRAKLDLLSAVGGLEDWAKQSAQPAASSTKVHSSSSSH